MPLREQRPGLHPGIVQRGYLQTCGDLRRGRELPGREGPRLCAIPMWIDRMFEDLRQSIRLRFDDELLRCFHQHLRSEIVKWKTGFLWLPVLVRGGGRRRLLQPGLCGRLLGLHARPERAIHRVDRWTVPSRQGRQRRPAQHLCRLVQSTLWVRRHLRRRGRLPLPCQWNILRGCLVRGLDTHYPDLRQNAHLRFEQRALQKLAGVCLGLGLQHGLRG